MKKTEAIDKRVLASSLKSRIARVTRELNQIYDELDFLENFFEKDDFSKDLSNNNTNIISFPGRDKTLKPLRGLKSTRPEPLSPYKALPGMSLPPDIPDFRTVLQRNGLILLGWDKRISEAGERYTAYWVTSTGTARFYASKQYDPESFSLAEPDRKSYAAEDGIDFYGQDAPAYLVHTAPELMMSNPRHWELRPAHIKALMHQGCMVDYKYHYLLSIEKGRNRAAKKNRQPEAL